MSEHSFVHVASKKLRARHNFKLSKHRHYSTDTSLLLSSTSRLSLCNTADVKDVKDVKDDIDVLGKEKCALIIGFEYLNDKPTIDDPAVRGVLPGIVIDLYQAVKIAREAGFTKIRVITDIYSDEKTTTVQKALADSIVQIDVLELIANLKKRSEYHYYNDKKSTLNIIEEIVSSSKYLFLYYTGHAYKGHILFPRHGQSISIAGQSYQQNIEDDRLSMVYLKRILLVSSILNFEAVVVMDCCNGNGMKLPYHMSDIGYRLNDDLSECGEYDWYFHQQRIICISSAMIDENSEAGRDGSTFSLHFFALLKLAISSWNNFIDTIQKQQHDARMMKLSSNLYRNKAISVHMQYNTEKTCNLKLDYILTTIQNKCLTQYDQTATIHVSHPDIRSLWPWLIHATSLKIHVDNTNKMLTIAEDT